MTFGKALTSKIGFVIFNKVNSYFLKPCPTIFAMGNESAC